MITASYPCAQGELYTACRLGWQSCRQHLADFTDFKPLYREAYITARLAEVEAAAALPDDQARNAPVETLRNRLVEKGLESLAAWQRLKRYIMSAYPPVDHKAMLEGAGSGYYFSASNENWDSLNSLLQSATGFLAANRTALEANDNMPPTFTGIMQTLFTDFTTLHTQYLDARETENIGTQAKIAANNDIFNRLMVMFLDGQEIFRNDEAVSRQFVMAEVLQKIGGAGTSGISGGVTEAVTGQPIPNVTVTVRGRDKSVLTNAQGRYEILQVAAGFYDISAEKEGYETAIIPGHEIKTGTVGRLDITLIPVPVTVPEPAVPIE